MGPKKQDFCTKINMLKGNFDTNYFEPLMIFSRQQKSEFLKLIISFLFSVPKLRSVQKTPMYFYYFQFKKTSLSGKYQKKTKKYQKPKSCRQLSQHLIHTVFQIFHMEIHDNQPLSLQLLKIISKWFKLVDIKISFEHVDS